LRCVPGYRLIPLIECDAQNLLRFKTFLSKVGLLVTIFNCPAYAVNKNVPLEITRSRNSFQKSLYARQCLRFPSYQHANTNTRRHTKNIGIKIKEGCVFTYVLGALEREIGLPRLVEFG